MNICVVKQSLFLLITQIYTSALKNWSRVIFLVCDAVKLLLTKLKSHRPPPTAAVRSDVFFCSRRRYTRESFGKNGYFL